MKYRRLLQYRVRRLLLGADPEALFFATAFMALLLGLGFSANNLLVLASSFILFTYGVALLLWLRKNYG